ncbi:putative CAP domain-containing protein [Seiridium cardinale]
MTFSKSGLVKLLLNALLLPLFFHSQAAFVSGATINVDENELADRAALTLDQSVALKTQNDVRQQKNLTLLAWDATLVQDAQTWANYLAKIDNMQHSTSDQRPNEGENLAYAWSSNGVKYPLTLGAQGWMAEEKNYHNEIIPQGDFASYGHYTQCMWRSTNKIGMASAKAVSGNVYTVGRYSPPGNYVGYRPY